MLATMLRCVVCGQLEDGLRAALPRGTTFATAVVDGMSLREQVMRHTNTTGPCMLRTCKIKEARNYLPNACALRLYGKFETVRR